MSGLPSGWAELEIGRVSKPVGGGTPPSQDPANFTYEGGVPWLTPADLSGYRSTYISRGKRNLTEAGLAACSARVLPPGTVLFSSRAPVGYVAIAANELATNQGFKSFPLPEGFDPRFVYYYLRHIRPIAEARATGTTFKELSGAAAAQLPLLVAPTNEQARIADKLDVLTARVDACRDRLDQVPAILRRFREALLSSAIKGDLTRAWRHAFEDEEPAFKRAGPDLSRLTRDEKPSDQGLQEWLLKLPASWGVERASQVVEPGADIVYGIVQPGPKLSEGVPYVRGMDIVDGKIQVNQLLRTSPEIADRYARASIKGGDVLLGIIRATKVAVVPESLNGANITQGTARFRPSKKILSGYLAIVLEAPETQQWLHTHYRGIDMPGLNLADVRRVPIPLPSLEEQAEVVRRVDSLVSLATSIGDRLEIARFRVDRLISALLAKAFRGELVPQDPSDEPATVLLERVAAAQLETKPARNSLPSFRGSQLKSSPKPTLREIIYGMPKKSFSFDELRQAVGGDYESLKGELFELLSHKGSGVEQYFDVKAGSMKLRRART